MALKRATRVGASTVLPLLCDGDYKAARGAFVLRGVGIPTGDTRATTPETRRVDADARERLFAESLDVSTLGLVPETVTRVTIRGMSGREFQEADEAAFQACAGDLSRFGHFRMVEVIRRGLVSVAGFDLARGPDGFPVESFADAAGSDWIAARTEIYERVEAWSHLGESAGSSSAPPAGEPT